MNLQDKDDAFLEGLIEPGDVEVAAALLATLDPIAPSSGLRGRILGEADERGRLYRFAATIAKMVDVSIDKAKELLDRLSDPSKWETNLFPGLDAVWVEGGAAAVGCIRGFGRLAAGKTFPDHVHHGTERQLVLQGTLVDSLGTVARPGDTVVMEAGTEHNYFAPANGPDLLFFVVIENGIDVEGVPLRHRD